MTEGASQLSAQAQAREDRTRFAASLRWSPPYPVRAGAFSVFRDRVTSAAAERDQEAVCGPPNAQKSSVVGAASKDSRATTGAEEDKSHSAACASGDWRAPKTSVRVPRRKCRARWPGPPETTVFWRHRFHVRKTEKARSNPFSSIQIGSVHGRYKFHIRRQCAPSPPP